MSNLITALLVIGGVMVIIVIAWVVIAVANLFALRGRHGRVERGVADKWGVPWLFEPPTYTRRHHDGGSHHDAGMGLHDSGHEHHGFDGGHHSG